MSGRTSSPTIADVAREAGVSISTVSRILNGSSLVASETVGKVRGAIQRLGYAPRSAARNLALRRTNTLGMLVESVGSTFFGEVVAGAEEAAHARGYNLVIATPNHLRAGDLPSLGPFNTDGLLLVNIQLEKQVYAFYQGGYPMVNLYQPAPRSLHIPFVSVENKRGTSSAIEHLITVHGATRIAFLRGPKGNSDSRMREIGFRQAMKKHNLPVDEYFVRDGGFAYPYARRVVLEWVRENRLPQAIFTGNDDAALDVIFTFHRLGIRVPEDVAIIGFDDAYNSPGIVPSLTTVHAPTEEVGRAGVRVLLQLLETGHADEITLLPTELVTRRSCGCLQHIEPESWPEVNRAVMQPSGAPVE